MSETSTTTPIKWNNPNTVMQVDGTSTTFRNKIENEHTEANQISSNKTYWHDTEEYFMYRDYT